MKIAPLVFALALAGCAGTLNTPHAVLEKAEVMGEAAYVETVNNLNSAAVAGRLSATDHDFLWGQAWTHLQNMRRLYNAGQSVTLAVQQLQVDAAASKGK